MNLTYGTILKLDPFLSSRVRGDKGHARYKSQSPDPGLCFTEIQFRKRRVYGPYLRKLKVKKKNKVIHLTSREGP
jgi:hypothetical protein